MGTAARAKSGRDGSKSKNAFRTISETADILDVPQHVLRFWESKFNQIKPMKRGGNRRYYRPDDIDLLKTIHFFLYTEGYTIKGVQKLLKEHGIKNTIDLWQKAASGSPAVTPELESAAVVADLKSADVKVISRELIGRLLREMRAVKKIVSNLPE